MKYKMVFKPTAVKDIQKLPQSIQKRIKIKLAFFLSQSDAMDYAVPLLGAAKDGEYRFRVGDYRVVFDKKDINLIVLYVEHRREVYKRR